MHASYKAYIDNIYSQESIYKSLIVCHDDETHISLFDELRSDDYPICNIKNVNNFKNDKSRLLIIDYIDYNNLHKILNQKDIEKLTNVFFIEYNKSNEKYIINNPEIKYYIIH